MQDDPEQRPDRVAMRAEVRRLMEARIDTLPDAFRTVFMLRAVEELSVEEIAVALEIPEATVRTRFFRARGLLSGAAVALLAGNEALAAESGGANAKDVQILNTALGAELEAIAAYQLGAESKLLEKPVLDLALTFQGHHKAHAEVLVNTVEKLGGKPVLAKATYNFPVDQLKTQADVLKFAAKLEQGAVSAYLGAVPLFGNRDLAKAAASILGDEAMHWAILRQALGEVPVPSAFMA